MAIPQKILYSITSFYLLLCSLIVVFGLAPFFKGWQPFEPFLAVTAILTLTPQDGGTLYAAQVLHRSASDAAKHDAMGFQQGWGTAIAQLATLVEGWT